MQKLRVACLALVVVGCGSSSNTKQTDAPVVQADAPNGPPDAPNDSTVNVDGPLSTDGIAAARAASDGASLTLPITGVTVTYVKPQIGNATNDPAGFTIQHDQTGPGLFIAVDPATLTPALAAGDVVSFTITTMGTVGMQRRAQAITSLTRTSQGADVTALATNISSATDVVTALDTYDSRLVSVTGTAFQAFATSGSGFQYTAISTTGVQNNVDLEVRAPATLVDSLDMANTCAFAITNVPVGRFNAQAQIGVFRASEIAVTGCPAPAVATAVSLDSTHVRATFTRNVAMATVTADGSQFTFDNSLTASAATVSGRTVTLTTGAQTPGTTYTLTVANTVTDLQGTALATPNTAAFPGFVMLAGVRINEVNATLGGGCDLVELRVISDGSMSGWTLKERTGDANSGELALTFPTFTVHKNDFIVVHLNSASTTCNPGGATQETTTVTDQAKATYGKNYDTAFDFYATDTGLTATSNVLTLSDQTGTIVDAVFLTDTTTAATVNTLTQAGLVGTASQWSPAQPTYASADFIAAAVDNLSATDAIVTGKSIQRLDDNDTNAKADWTTGAGAVSTFGALNANQATLP